jgi:hypothetical protein
MPTTCTEIKRFYLYFNHITMNQELVAKSVLQLIFHIFPVIGAVPSRTSA